MEACRDELSVSLASIVRDHVFVAEAVEGKPLGFYHLCIRSSVGEIDAFFVDPDAMLGGIGSRLWQHMEGELRARRVTKLDVESDPNAVGFYQAMGMTLAGEVPSQSIPGRSLPLLKKDL